MADIGKPLRKIDVEPQPIPAREPKRETAPATPAPPVREKEPVHS